VADDAKDETNDKGAGKRWTPEQDEALRNAVDEFGQRNWKVRWVRILRYRFNTSVTTRFCILV
jgi:hypothetical protein